QYFLKDISTGPASDIKVLTDIARDMVMIYGMSDLGPINFQAPAMFGAWRGEEGANISPAFQDTIDKEVKKIIDQAWDNAKLLVKKHQLEIKKVATRLLELETLDGDEFEKI